MAVRSYRDAKGRTRFSCEFQQGGQRVLRRLYAGATRGDAQALETKLRGEIFSVATLGQVPEISLEEAVIRWLRDTLPHKKDKKKPAQNARLLAPFVSGKSLRQVPEAAREAVATWARGMLQASAPNTGIPIPKSGAKAGAIRGATKALTPATINRRLCVLKAAAKYAYQQGWIDTNLSGRISLLPEQNKREVYLTAAQVKALAKAAPSSRSRSAIMLAAYSGLRASELLALTSTGSQAHTLSVLVSKTGKPRNVPIVGLLRPYLSALPLGLSYRQLVGEFWQAREKANMPHVRFHDLRHSCASMLINAGVDLYTVGAILGHSSPATTARYAHLAQATLKRAMGKLK